MYFHMPYQEPVRQWVPRNELLRSCSCTEIVAVTIVIVGITYSFISYYNPQDAMGLGFRVSNNDNKDCFAVARSSRGVACRKVDHEGHAWRNPQEWGVPLKRK